MNRFRATLERSLALTPTTKHLQWQVAGGASLAFTAGQFLSLELGPHTRAYSIASPPQDDARFELCLNRVPGGAVSNHLCDLEPGAVLEFSGPYGFFTVAQPVDRDLVFIATGTGIAPVRSMLADLLAHGRAGGHRLTLIFGVRHEQSLLYRDELEQLARVHQNFAFVPTLSRPSPGWRGQSGHVQQALLDRFARRSDFAAYVCGLRAMVDDVRLLLRERCRLDRKQVHHERYD
ncbi:MAG: FAD-binding oxidoreductase [Planctomycetota bacterium]